MVLPEFQGLRSKSREQIFVNNFLISRKETDSSWEWWRRAWRITAVIVLAGSYGIRTISNNVHFREIYVVSRCHISPNFRSRKTQILCLVPALVILFSICMLSIGYSSCCDGREARDLRANKPFLIIIESSCRPGSQWSGQSYHHLLNRQYHNSGLDPPWNFTHYSS